MVRKCYTLPTNRKTKTANLLDMTKETIMNNYAIEQGYECWDNLVNEKINEQRLSLYYDFNVIIDLIQEELKKKCADRFNGGFERYRVIETEIL